MLNSLVEFIENQTKTRQSGLSAKPRLLKSSQFENMPRTMTDFRLLLTLTKNFTLCFENLLLLERWYF